MTDGHISIRPGVSILSVLPHLNYRPWFAIAEFVDNSVQSYLTHHAEIVRSDGRNTTLVVTIDTSTFDSGRITIRDNAAGIHQGDYGRAFRPAAIPPDRSGLSEFGMGMKSAACWFARSWTVRTKALGELVERTVHFDIDKIVRDNLEELEVGTHGSPINRHYTEIVLSDLYNCPRGRTLGKIKDHLASIYRIYIKDGALTLKFDGDTLSYSEPKILHAPYFKAPSDSPVTWRKDIDMDFGDGLSAKGFAALRETASTSTAGFALFRRNRLIQGSADEGYRPPMIFGAPNSYTYQRLFGELHLEGFDVSHTKDGFRWQEHEEVFLELLKDELDRPPCRLLQQAEEFRVRQKPADLKAGAELATKRTAEVIVRETSEVFSRQLSLPPDLDPPPLNLVEGAHAARRTIDMELHGTAWRIEIELSTDAAVGNWIELSEQPKLESKTDKKPIHKIGMRLNLVHPFMERFAGGDPARIEPLLRLAAGLMLAEIAARIGGASQAGTIRRNLNELLRDSLSRP